MTDRNRFVERSSILFLTNGIKDTSMVDIALECNTSKEIIYKNFKDKEYLINQIIQFQIEEMESKLKNCSVNSLNAIVELNYFFNYLKEFLLTISPDFYGDLKFSYPDIFKRLIIFKDTVIIPFLQKNILRGKKEKIYKYDLNSKEISQSYNLVYQILISDNFFLLLEKNKQAIDFLNTLFLHRLVTIKGLKLISSLD